MRKHSELPTFDRAILPEEIKNADFEVNIFNYSDLRLFIKQAAEISFVEAIISLHFEMSRKAFAGNTTDNKDFDINMKNWMNRLGYILIDIVVPTILKKGKPTIALNLLDSYRKECWFFEDTTKLRSAHQQSVKMCLRALESKMIDDLQYAHKGQARVDKFARLFSLLERNMGDYSFPHFFLEFTKRVARKPEDINLMYSIENEAFSAHLLQKVVKTLEDQRKFDVVQAIEEMPGNRTLLERAA